jgi:hypothetical protein
LFLRASMMIDPTACTCIPSLVSQASFGQGPGAIHHFSHKF